MHTYLHLSYYQYISAEAQVTEISQWMGAVTRAKEFAAIKLLPLWPFPKTKKTALLYRLSLHWCLCQYNFNILWKIHFGDILNNKLPLTHLFWSLFYCSRCSAQCTVHIFSIYFKGFWISTVNKILLLKI